MPRHFDLVVFDLDGVLTDTARVHATAWKQLFDDFLARRAARAGAPFIPFDAVRDYRAFVDGKPRYDGVRSFLASRGVELPWGDPGDDPSRDTVCGLGNRKNRWFEEALRREGAEVFPHAVAFARALEAAGVRRAVASSSKNCALILDLAGIAGLFEARVDGVYAAERGLRGKPEPDIFLECARILGAPPGRTVVVEDAISGVEAGRRGGFALVLGVDRSGDGEALRRHGADVVVPELTATPAQVDAWAGTAAHRRPLAPSEAW